MTDSITNTSDPRKVSGLCAVLTLIIGGLGLAGWIFDIEALKRIHPALVTMKVNTAIGLMLAACSLLLLRDEKASGWKRGLARCFAAAIAMLGLATLGEHLLGQDFGIDQWLFRETPAEAGISFPGRMGVVSTLVFCLFGAALFFLDTSVAGRYWAGNLAFMALLLTGLIFLYYFYGIEEFHPITKYATIALHTVVAFVFLSAGILLARPSRGIMASVLGHGAGSVVARRLLPSAILLTVFFGWLRTLGWKAGWYGPAFGTAAFVVVITLMFTALVWWTIRALNRQEAQRQRAEDLSRAERERSEGILASITESFYALDDEYRFTYVNAAAAETFARLRNTSRSVLGRTLWDEFPSVLGTRMEEEFRRALNEKVTRSFEHFYESSREWYRINLFPSTEGLSVFFQNITQSKHAEEALSQSESRKAAILNAALDAIITMDHNGILVDLNPAAEIIFGYRREDSVGKPLADLIIPERLRERHYAGMKRYLASGEGPVLGKRIEMPALHADGREFPVELSISRVPDVEPDAPPMFTATLRDITVRKRAEEAQAFLAAIVLSSDDAILSKTLEGIITTWNVGAERIFGYTAEEIVGQPVLRLIPPELRAEEDRILARLRAGERIERYETVRVTKAGKRLNVSLTISPMKSAMGQIIGASKIVHDITERKKGEEVLRKNARLLKAVAGSARVGLVIVNSQYEYLFANDAYGEVLGLPTGEIVGQLVPEIMRAGWAQIQPQLDRALAGERVAYELTLPARSGEDEGPRYFTIIYEPHTDEAGRPSVVVVVVDITERQRAEQKLRASEERYRTLFDSMDEGFCIVEVVFDEQQTPVDYRFIEINPAFAKQTGLSDARGKLMRELAPAHEQHWFDAYGKVALTGEPIRFENEAAALHRWYDVYAFRIQESRRVGILFNDVTLRKQAEESLRESQLRLAAEVNALANLHQTSTRLLAAPNVAEAAQVTLESVTSLVGATHGTVQVYDPVERGLRCVAQRGFDAAALPAFAMNDRESDTTYARAMRTGERVIVDDFETDSASAKHRATAAALGYRSAYSTPFKTASGELLGMLTVHFRDPHHPDARELRLLDLRVRQTADLMERVRAEEKLRESEQAFRAMADNIAPLAWMAHADGSIFFYNKRWYDFTGTTFQEMQGWGWEKVHDPAHLTHVLLTWKAALEKGEPWEDTFPLRGWNGEYRWFLSRAFPIHDGHGKIVRWFGTNSDVTELREAQELLASRAKQLEKLVEERTVELQETVQQLETFSYSIVHDMRAPLRSMRSFASILGDQYWDKHEPEARGYLSRIMNSAGRLDALITDVLSYSRVAMDETELAKVDLDKLIPEIVDQYPQFQEAASAIHLNRPLPVVCGNTALLTQVFSNLLGNALKFVAPGEKPRVVVRAETNGSLARVWIEDNGIGIPADQREKVFGLFQRLHQAGAYPGTGVGLAIVRKAVERMGGRVDFESELGQGTRFWVELEIPKRA